jgi:uncharacterized protein YdeI (BOF family)
MNIPKGMIQNLDMLIELSQKKTKLLMDMKCALEEEGSNYIVCNVSNQEYVLVDKKTKINIEIGSKTKIEQYITKRRLIKVYWRKNIKFNTELKILELT